MSDRKRTVLMLGGNRSTIGAIRAIKAAGFHLILAERLPRQDAMQEVDTGWEIEPGDVEALRLAIASFGPIDGIIGINETAMRSAAILQDRLNLPGLPPEVINKTCSKFAQRQAWNADPILYVPYHLVHNCTELLAAAADLAAYPLVVKPDLSYGGSRGVSAVSGAEELEQAFAFATSHALDGSNIVVERALLGPQFSAELLVQNGKTSVIAIGRKIKSRLPYCVDLAICYPGLTDPQEIMAVEEMCAHAAARLGIVSGPGHIEFAMTAEGPRPIELGARSGGSLTVDLAAHVSDCHPMVQAARLACGLPVDLRPLQNKRGAVLMFLAFPPGRMTDLHIPADVKTHPGVLDVYARLPDDGIIQPIQWTSQRCGYIGVTAKDGPAALALAQEMAQRIYVVTEAGEKIPPLTFQ